MAFAFLVKREDRHAARAAVNKLAVPVNSSGCILSFGPAPDGVHSLTWLFLSRRLDRNRSSHVRNQREPPSINTSFITVAPSAQVIRAYSHQFNSEKYL